MDQVVPRAEEAEALTTPPCAPPVLELPRVKRISLSRQLRGSPFSVGVTENGKSNQSPGVQNGQNLLAPSGTPSTPVGTLDVSPRPRSPAQRLLFANGAESPPQPAPVPIPWSLQNDDREGAEFMESPTALYAQFSALRTT